MKTGIVLHSTVLLTLATSIAGCGKDVEIGDLGSGSSSNEIVSCGGDRLVHWSFNQPATAVTRSVDLLFVVDTSASLAPERAKIAATLPLFAKEMPAGTDYRVGVMLAHGGASSRSGRLYAPSGVSKVLSSSTMSAAQIQMQLTNILSSPPGDSDEAGGEMMLYSLARATEPSRLGEAQALGFFRPNAALAVVFVSDENDVCYPASVHGLTGFPDDVPSNGGWETIAFKRYCNGVSPESVIAKLRSLKADKPLSFAAITHLDGARVPHATGDEDSLGHGMIELVNQTLNGALIEISDPSYSAGIAGLGAAVSESLDLKTVFFLSNATGIDSRSVRTSVDGRAIGSRFEASTASVQIATGDAGGAGSLIEVNACR